MISSSLVEGPLFWDCNGELREPIWTCMTDKLRCQHLSVHEGHHFYCSAQPIEGQTYPAIDAGKQLHDPRVENDCDEVDD